MASHSASGSRSVIWKLMERSDDRKRVTCKLCRSVFAMHGSTTTMMKHLQKIHPTDLEAAKREKETEHERTQQTTSSSTGGTGSLIQMSLVAAVERSRPYDPSGPKQKTLDKLLIEMIAADLQPFSIVEDRRFRRFVKGLDPKYTLPSRRTLTRNLLPQLYDSEKKRVVHMLEEANFICLTTDHWSSRRIQGFITVTAHFINDEWELQSFVLDTARITTALTAQAIANVLNNVMETWGIKNKVFAVITDNAANMKAAVEILGVRHGPCFAHTLNLVVMDALNSPQAGMEDIKRKIKHVVSHFKHSVKASDNLERIQKEARITSEPLRLVQEVEKRWNSTFFIFQRFLHLYGFIKAALLEEDKPDQCLTEEELKTVKEAVEVLEPFELTTREMSADKFPTALKVIPLIDNLSRLMYQMSGNLAAALKAGLQSRFAGAEERFLWAAATFVDPRFKKHGFRDQSNAQVIKDRLIGRMRPVPESAEEEMEQAPAATASTTFDKLWSHFDSKIRDVKKSKASTLLSPQIEMRRHLEGDLLPRQQSSLFWWKQNASFFPQLQEQAKKYLACPATSVSSERLFSKAGELVSHRRANLKDTTINMLLFLNKNIEL